MPTFWICMNSLSRCFCRHPDAPTPLTMMRTVTVLSIVSPWNRKNNNGLFWWIWVFFFFPPPAFPTFAAYCGRNRRSASSRELPRGCWRRKSLLMWMILHQELIGWCSIANSTWCIAFSIERYVTKRSCCEKVTAGVSSIFNEPRDELKRSHWILEVVKRLFQTFCTKASSCIPAKTMR